nr:hypothetical protein [Clavibacter michiganensis]
MKVRVSARDKTTGEVREVAAEGTDYQKVKAGLLENVPGDLQVIMIRTDRPEVIR